jgi:hypothetical protein
MRLELERTICVRLCCLGVCRESGWLRLLSHALLDLFCRACMLACEARIPAQERGLAGSRLVLPRLLHDCFSSITLTLRSLLTWTWFLFLHCLGVFVVGFVFSALCCAAFGLCFVF